MKLAILIFGCVTLVLTGCKKPVTEPNSGIYRGSFFDIKNGQDTVGQGLAHLALSKDGFGGNFQLSGDTLSGAPYSCSGTYVIDNSSKMTFTSVSGTYGAVTHYKLDTTYSYTFDDYNFGLTLELDSNVYSYQLIRI